MAGYLNPAHPIKTGDTTVSAIYRLADAEGSIWRSSSKVLVNALRGDGSESGTVNASGEWLRIPTLRHLLPGTVAQIEIYVQRDNAERQLLAVVPNDPTVDYVEYSPNYTSTATLSLTDTLAAAGVGEIDYTTGGALPNDPPPAMSCVTVWRNRAIGANGNSIYTSQEFAAGLGLQWSNTLRIEWNEGSGDITAICPIDFNYCAVFKKDAIGIISGPGPDGMGHGNYIVQTLQTKMGVSNPKSVVNGADGCYFQDAATKRVAALTPQLNPSECLIGWFNESGANVTCAMQVEQRRQVWFGTDDGQIIVLDYKHRNQRCPFGQVFTWNLSAFSANAIGMAIVSNVPTVLFSDGALGTYSDAQAADILDDGTQVEILRTFETGELQPNNLQGSFDVTFVQFLGEYLSPHKLRLTTFPGFLNSGTATTPKEITAEPEQLATKPPNCQRIQSLRVRIEELSTVDGLGHAIYGKGFDFVGLAVEIQMRTLQRLDVGRIV